MLERANTDTVLFDGDRTGEVTLDVGCADSDLDKIARDIKERDRLAAEFAHDQWLENGRDLLKAKAILGHGEFEAWCERALSYTTRTAQKLMRAAEMWGPILETEPGSVLPKPTVVYALSAPSVPQAIRDAYAPRVMAGENVLDEVRAAIKEHRDAVKQAEEEARRAATSREAQKAMVQRDASDARRVARETEERRVEQERQAGARSEALELIIARLGNDLPYLLALAAEAGGSVFNWETERELRSRAREAAAAPIAAEAGVAIDKTEVIEATTVTAPAVSEGEKSAWGVLPEIAGDEPGTVKRPQQPHESPHCLLMIFSGVGWFCRGFSQPLAGAAGWGDGL